MERKKLLREWVETIKLAPETSEVSIHYKVPEPMVNGLVAGPSLKLFTIFYLVG